MGSFAMLAAACLCFHPLWSTFMAYVTCLVCLLLGLFVATPASAAPPV